MQNVPRLNAAIILTGALLFPCSSPYAQSQTDTLPNQQLAGPRTPRSNPPGTAAASAAGPEKRISKNFTLKGDSDWIDTGIDVASGEHVVATAKGTMRYANSKEDNGPDGLPRGFKDLLRILPYNSAGRGALIGRVGDADVAQPFLLGASYDVAIPVGGRLSIAINQSKSDTGDGSYNVRIEIIAADKNSPATFTVAKSVTAVPGVNVPSPLPSKIEILFEP